MDDNTKAFIGNTHILYESILAEVIDDIYLEMKEDFVDYKNGTHKLGMFKELVKTEFHNKLRMPK